jgi:preprotein translocase subunit SecD
MTASAPARETRKAGMTGFFLLGLLLAALIVPAPASAQSLVLEIASAVAAFDQRTGKPIVAFRLTARSTKQFAQITTLNVGRKMELRVDGRVMMAPVIREPILGGQGQISDPDWTVAQAQELAGRLSTGKAKVEVEIVAN